MSLWGSSPRFMIGHNRSAGSAAPPKIRDLLDGTGETKIPHFVREDNPKAKEKRSLGGDPLEIIKDNAKQNRDSYSVDSISKPQASRRGSGMYFEFLLRRAHSRRRVERRYWSGVSLYSRTTCSNSVMVGTTGPMGSGLPQFGFPRRFAMKHAFPTTGE